MDKPVKLVTLGTQDTGQVSLACPFFVVPSVFSNVYLSCVLCVQCCQFYWLVHSSLPLQFSLTFICPVSGVFNVANTKKNTTQYVLDTTMRNLNKHKQRRHEPYYKQLEVKMNRTSFSCGNRNGHHNTGLTKLKRWATRIPPSVFSNVYSICIVLCIAIPLYLLMQIKSYYHYNRMT
jgi:hypothetical protein